MAFATRQAARERFSTPASTIAAGSRISPCPKRFAQRGCDRAHPEALLSREPCRASRRSGCSKRSRVASRSSAPWDDCEALFRAERDYLVAADGAQMRDRLRSLREDPQSAQQLADNGLQTILSRHTCAHRVDELLSICAGIE